MNKIEELEMVMLKVLECNREATCKEYAEAIISSGYVKLSEIENIKISINDKAVATTTKEIIEEIASRLGYIKSPSVGKFILICVENGVKAHIAKRIYQFLYDKLEEEKK